MKKITKKILTTLCAMFLSVFMFAGCNLVEINRYKYYNADVAVVSLQDGYGDEYGKFAKTYKKKDLINAYYSYAYNYVNQGQLTVEAGVTYAMNNMINNDLLFNYVKLNYFDNPDFDLEYTTADANDVKLQAFDSMQDEIYKIEKEIFEEWGINYTDEDELTDEETTSLRASYTEYVPSLKYVEYEGNEYVVLEENEEKEHDTRVAGEHFKQIIRHEGVSREAYTRYVKQLQDAAKEQGEKDTSEKTVLEKEELRLIEIFERSKYLEIFEKWYNKKYNFTYNNVLNAYVLNEEVMNQVIENYVDGYEAQQALYNANESAYHKAMGGNDVSGVYYHPNSGNEYVYVSHILLKFSNAQIAKIKELDKKLSKNLITQTEYDELVQDIADRTVVTYELNGNTYTSTAAKVYDKITGYVGNGGDASERARLFNDMIYIYNDDEGIMNKDFAYVVNLDTSIEDKMVKPFANEARRMHNEGRVGDVSKMIITEYGVHIMFYAGDVENVVSDIDAITAFDLMEVKTQLSSNKSLFDMVYDTLSLEVYQNNLTNFIMDCRDQIVNIEFKKGNYKDMYK